MLILQIFFLNFTFLFKFKQDYNMHIILYVGLNSGLSRIDIHSCHHFKLEFQSYRVPACGGNMH